MTDTLPPRLPLEVERVSGDEGPRLRIHCPERSFEKWPFARSPAGRPRQVMVWRGRPDAWAPSPDGRWVATSFGGRWVQLLDARSGALRRELPLTLGGDGRGIASDHGHYPLRVEGLTFTGSGEVLLITQLDDHVAARFVTAWSLEGPEPELLAWRTFGWAKGELRTWALGDADVLIAAWHQEDGTESGAEESAFVQTLARVRARDGRPVFSERAVIEVRERSLAERAAPPGAEVFPARRPRSRGVERLVATPDGETLVTAQGGRVVLRSGRSGGAEGELEEAGDLGASPALALHPDGRTLAVASAEGVVVVDLRSRARLATAPAFERCSGAHWIEGGGALLITGSGVYPEEGCLFSPVEGGYDLLELEQGAGETARLRLLGSRRERGLGVEDLALDRRGTCVALPSHETAAPRDAALEVWHPRRWVASLGGGSGGSRREDPAG